MPLDRIANCLDAPVESSGNAAMHIGGAGTGDRQSSSPGDDPIVFVGGELAEPAPPLNPSWIFPDKPLDSTGREADPLAAVNRHPLGDETMVPPARDGFGRDIEPPGKILN